MVNKVKYPVIGRKATKVYGLFYIEIRLLVQYNFAVIIFDKSWVF